MQALQGGGRPAMPAPGMAMRMAPQQAGAPASVGPPPPGAGPLRTVTPEQLAALKAAQQRAQVVPLHRAPVADVPANAAAKAPAKGPAGVQA